MVDLVYGDGPTPLCRWAEERGARLVDGLEVLVRQGARASSVWTGSRPSTSCAVRVSRPRLVHPPRSKPTGATPADMRGNGDLPPLPSRPPRGRLLGATVLRRPERSHRRRDSRRRSSAAFRRPARPRPPALTGDGRARRQALRSAFDFGRAQERGGSTPSSGSASPPPSACSGAFAVGRPKETPRLQGARSPRAGLHGGFVSVDGKAYFVRGDTGWRSAGGALDAADGQPAARRASLDVGPRREVRGHRARWRRPD